ncbi:hypothetical protein B932_3643 (plasmid) [Gluconobacter oxydans H24]|nr:hypothetical protein B932_3643 [Gluconobacter oxydans H24]
MNEPVRAALSIFHRSFTQSQMQLYRTAIETKRPYTAIEIR